ncbi:MAG: methyltransferase domain-containing protein, partial [Bacteroidetes bacterium]|nr:methyltransferase domain-containing protein [Bacteroidota bacterium]
MENEQIIVECPLCCATPELKHKKYPGYQEPATFKIYHCPECNTAFSLPMTESISIYENIYKNGDLVPGYDRYWKYAQKVKETENPIEYLSDVEEIYWGVKEALSLIVKDKETSKILEIGSGLGYLTYSLIKANYDVIGLDISKTAVKQAVKNYGNHYICEDLFKYVILNAESFDVIILTEVIEHVVKPKYFVEAILKLLKPGGQIILTTPNKSFYPADIIWHTELPPIHYWWFSEESIKHIAGTFNLEVKFINFKKYFNKHYRTCNIYKCRNSALQSPIFDIAGELIKKNNHQNIHMQYSQLLFSK